MSILLIQQPSKASARSRRNSHAMGLSARGDSRLHLSSPNRVHFTSATSGLSLALSPELGNALIRGKGSWDHSENEHEQHKLSVEKAQLRLPEQTAYRTLVLAPTCRPACKEMPAHPESQPFTASHRKSTLIFTTERRTDSRGFKEEMES